MELILFLTNNNNLMAQERLIPATLKDCDSFLFKNINKNTKMQTTEKYVSVES